MRFVLLRRFVTLLMEVDRTLKHFDGDMIQALLRILQERQPGRRSILFAHGVEVVPVKTATLPPADHTNAYLVGDPEGNLFSSILLVGCGKGWNNLLKPLIDIVVNWLPYSSPILMVTISATWICFVKRLMFQYGEVNTPRERFIVTGSLRMEMSLNWDLKNGVF